MKTISADTALCQFPVVVLTTYGEELDIAAMDSLRCNSYVT